MAKIVYRQMPATRELSQQMLAPLGKTRMQKPQGAWGQIFGANPRGCAGEGMVMDEIDTCIINREFGPYGKYLF